MNDQERAAFEAWFEAISNGTDDADAMWLAWQAGRAALAAAPVQAVPDGWKLVPVDPTEGMQYAGAAGIGGMPSHLEDAVRAYRAMLAAAPAAPQVPAVMVDMCPPATARDRWMYEQGRLAERDPRTHAIERVAAPGAPQPAEPAPLTVPHPASQEASAMIDSELTLRNWPTNTKNAARAGYEACRKLMGAGIRAAGAG